MTVSCSHCIVQSAESQKNVFIVDPTIWQPGFDFPVHTWCALNRFQASLLQIYTNGALDLNYLVNYLVRPSSDTTSRRPRA